MSWTYSNPADSTRDELRFLIGDTIEADPLLTDEELDYLLDDRGSVTGAAVGACEQLIARFAREPDRRIGQLSISNSQRVTQYEKLLKTLRTRTMVSAVPYAGGISVADKQNNIDNSDRPRMPIHTGMMTNHGS